MTYKYKAKFNDITDISYSLEIYKTYTDTIKEVRLVDNPQIDCKTPDYIIDGGLCTTGVKFSLLGTNAEDLMTIALSELTEYKVLIRNTGLNTIVYFGYLINGVYEVDYSLCNNYAIEFAASDFKVLEDSKGCTNGLTDSLASFISLFEKTCIYNEYKSQVKINICTSTISGSNKATETTISTDYSAGLFHNVQIESLSLKDEKDVPMNDFDIIDGLLKQYGCVLMQFNGELYLYEVGKSNMYNDTHKCLLTEFNSVDRISTELGVNSWLNCSIPSQVKWYGSQSLSVTEKFDKLKIKPDYNYKDNYADLKYNLPENDRNAVAVDDNLKVIWKTTGKDAIGQAIWKIPNSYINTKIYESDTMFYMTVLSNSGTQFLTHCGIVGYNNPKTHITFIPRNTYNYAPNSVNKIRVQVNFDMYLKGRNPDPISDYMGGDITLMSSTGTILGKKRYVCYNDNEGSDIIYRKLAVPVVVVDEDKDKEEIPIEERKKFIFDIPYTKECLDNIIVVFSKPYFTQAYPAHYEMVDFWSVNNLEISFVKQSIFNQNWGTFQKWDKYEEEKPQELIVESETLTNNIAKTETFEYNYICNDKLYPLIVNSLYDKGKDGSITFLSSLCKNRTSKLICAGWDTLENINIDILFKQLNVRRLKLEANLKYNGLIKPNKYFTINTIQNKSFIITGYSFNISDMDIELTLEEFIK